MQGRSKFSRQEADEIKRILLEKATVDRSRQKVLRGQLRSKYRFYITDFRSDPKAFIAMDFDQLVRTGAIVIEGAAATALEIPGVDLSVLYEDAPADDLAEGDPVTRAPASDKSSDETWYDRLREAYRPTDLRYLMIAESPPDPRAGDRRFFYAPVLSQYDNLYRGVATSVYGLDTGFDVTRKTHVLERLRTDGFWLIDAVQEPINRSSGKARHRAIRDEVRTLVQRCQDLAPSGGIIVCHSVVFEEVITPMRAARLTVLHDEPLPFPLGNWRAQFVEGFRRALGSPRLP